MASSYDINAYDVKQCTNIRGNITKVNGVVKGPPLVRLRARIEESKTRKQTEFR